MNILLKKISLALTVTTCICLNMRGENSQLFFKEEPFMVWGTSSDNKAWFLEGVSPQNPQGTKWVQIPDVPEGGLKQIACSSYTVCGINQIGNVFTRRNISNENPKGTRWDQDTQVKNIKQIDYANPNIIGVNTDNQVLIYRTIGKGSSFKVEDNTIRLTVVSSKDLKSAVWGISASGEVWFSDNQHMPTLYRGSSNNLIPESRWKKIDNSAPGGKPFITISSSQFNVWGISQDKNVFYRKDITQANQKGSSWSSDGMDKKMNYVSCSDYGVWGIDEQGTAWFREGVTPTTPGGTSWKCPYPDIRLATIACSYAAQFRAPQDSDLKEGSVVAIKSLHWNGYLEVTDGKFLSARGKDKNNIACQFYILRNGPLIGFKSPVANNNNLSAIKEGTEAHTVCFENHDFYETSHKAQQWKTLGKTLSNCMIKNENHQNLIPDDPNLAVEVNPSNKPGNGRVWTADFISDGPHGRSAGRASSLDARNKFSIELIYTTEEAAKMDRFLGGA